MIQGHVTARLDAVIDVSLRGPSDKSATVLAVVDTGYDRYLVIPFALIEALMLPPRGTETAVLADGSVTQFQRFEATVIWHGDAFKISVEGTEGDALVGMRLLAGSRLTMDIKPDGIVTVTLLA